MKQEEIIFDPSCDGKTHIRISPMAATDLGKKLSIGAKVDIIHPHHGYFASLLAFWVWINEGGMVDSVRNIHQSNLIRTTLSLVRNKDIGKEDVISMLYHWIDNSPDIRQQLCKTTLPFVAYDFLRLGPDNYHVIQRPDLQWYVDALNLARSRVCKMGGGH